MTAITDTIMQQQGSDLMFSFSAQGDPDAGFVVKRFHVRERVSSLYRAEVDLASEKNDIDLTKLMDKPGVLTIHDRYGQPRYFHGVVEEVERGDVGDRYTFYRVVLMPQLNRLRFISDCRIFQQKSIVEIIETILQENNQSNYKFDMPENHPTREYCVQYRESDFNFIARLLAEEGSHFTHSHSKDGHTLNIRDTSFGAPDVPVTSSMEYNAAPGGDVQGPFLRKFSHKERVESSAVSLRDHSFRHPRYQYPAQATASKTNGLAGKLEHYDFPGRHKTDEAGKAFAQFRLDHYRGKASNGTGEGYFPHATVAAVFALTDHPVKALNQKYFITEAVHHGQQPTALQEDTGSEASPQAGGTFMTTQIRHQSFDMQYRPKQLVKPVVDGVQLAIVTGPENEQIYTDEFSRVRVMFPWDRRAKGDDTSSCWIRVCQNWGGGKWGHVAIPRVGHHVLIAYTEGDPDQPLIIGRAYNVDNQTPYKLPDHKAKMALRSDTHKGEGYNELSFDDERDAQNFFTHAQRDMTSKVRNNQIHAVDASGFHSYGQQHQLTVGANMNHNVGGGLNQVIGAATGAGAAALMGGALGGLMGQSAGMLQQAMAIAGQMSGTASGSGTAASAATDTASTAASAFAAPTDSAGQSAIADSHASSLASAALGAAPAIFDQAFSAATSATPQDLSTAGGASMASAGSSLLGSLGSLLGGGVFNQLVGMMKNTTVGVASTEQVGISKVLSVGKVFIETIGHTRKITVGDQFTIECGKSKFMMNKEGHIAILGTQFHFEATGPVQIRGKVIDHN